MTLQLYAHPFSSYSQKVLIALYENATPFTYRRLGPDDPAALAEWVALWPLRRFPVLVDKGRQVREASLIVEYLDQRHPGPVRLVPTDFDAALDIRFLDRFFDNYVMTPMQQVVFDARRQEADRDPLNVSEAFQALDLAYDWLERHMAGRTWAAGDAFTLADCAAAPSLFYADWVHEIGASRPRLVAYRTRLLQRPSFARAVDEARPFRHFFPPGAPDRD